MATAELFSNHILGIDVKCLFKAGASVIQVKCTNCTSLMTGCLLIRWIFAQV